MGRHPAGAQHSLTKSPKTEQTETLLRADLLLGAEWPSCPTGPAMGSVVTAWGLEGGYARTTQSKRRKTLSGSARKTQLNTAGGARHLGVQPADGGPPGRTAAHVGSCFLLTGDTHLWPHLPTAHSNAHKPCFSSSCSEMETSGGLVPRPGPPWRTSSAACVLGCWVDTGHSAWAGTEPGEPCAAETAPAKWIKSNLPWGRRHRSRGTPRDSAQSLLVVGRIWSSLLPPQGRGPASPPPPQALWCCPSIQCPSP